MYENLTFEEMIERMVEYYRESGFPDYYEDELKKKTKKEIDLLFLKTFGQISQK